MSAAASRPRRYRSAVGDGAAAVGDAVRVVPALTRDAGRPLSAYTAYFPAGARADLPAAYDEVWVVLSGSLRVGAGPHAVTVRAGEFVHVPERAAGIVDALEDTTAVCVSAPAH